MRLPHTATYRGRRVFVILKDGRRIVDRFVERTANKYVILQNAGRIHVSDIRAFSDFRHQPRHDA
jgi:hypothetical protein